MIICARLLDYGCEVINAKVLEDDEKITLPKCNFSSKSLQSMIGCNCFVDINAGTLKLVVGDKVEIILI